MTHTSRRGYLCINSVSEKSILLYKKSPSYRYNKQNIGRSTILLSRFLGRRPSIRQNLASGPPAKNQTNPPPVHFNLLKSYLQNRYFVTTYNKELHPHFQCSRVPPKEASWVRYFIRYTQQISHNPTQQISAPSRTTRPSSQLIQILP